MDRYVMRHPDIEQPGMVPESALEHHRGRGWIRVSDAISERNKDQVTLADYADAPDLDAAPAALEAPGAKTPAKQQTKEK